jgi:hypothetical protein
MPKKYFLNEIKGFTSLNFTINANLTDLETDQKKMVLLTSIIAIILVTTGIFNFTIYNKAFSQAVNNSNNYVRYNIFDGQFSVEIPQNWSLVNSNHNAAMFLCNNGTSCQNAVGLTMFSYNIPSSGATASSLFDFALQNERNSGMVVINQPVTSADTQTIGYTMKLGGQQFKVIAVHKIFDNHLYVAQFIFPPEDEQEFMPVLKHVTSTWRAYDLNGGSSGLNSLALQTQNDINKITHCTNMGIISSMNVDPGHKYFDSNCNQWMYAP